MQPNTSCTRVADRYCTPRTCPRQTVPSTEKSQPSTVIVMRNFAPGQRGAPPGRFCPSLFFLFFFFFFFNFLIFLRLAKDNYLVFCRRRTVAIRDSHPGSRHRLVADPMADGVKASKARGRGPITPSFPFVARIDELHTLVPGGRPSFEGAWVCGWVER